MYWAPRPWTRYVFCLEMVHWPGSLVTFDVNVGTIVSGTEELRFETMWVNFFELNYSVWCVTCLSVSSFTNFFDPLDNMFLKSYVNTLPWIAIDILLLPLNISVHCIFNHYRLLFLLCLQERVRESAIFIPPNRNCG